MKTTTSEIRTSQTKVNYQLSFSSYEELKNSYLPFIKGGGLFIPTENDHRLNETISVSLQYGDEPEKHDVEGQIVWITPDLSQHADEQGIGVQLTSPLDFFEKLKKEAENDNAH